MAKSPFRAILIAACLLAAGPACAQAAGDADAKAAASNPPVPALADIMKEVKAGKDAGDEEDAAAVPAHKAEDEHMLSYVFQTYEEMKQPQQQYTALIAVRHDSDQWRLLCAEKFTGRHLTTWRLLRDQNMHADTFGKPLTGDFTRTPPQGALERTQIYMECTHVMDHAQSPEHRFFTDTWRKIFHYEPKLPESWTEKDQPQ